MIVNILMPGKLPTTIKKADKTIAVGSAATKKKSDYFVSIDAEQIEKLKLVGAPQLICPGDIGVKEGIHLRVTSTTWETEIELALATAKYCKAEKVRVIGEVDEDELNLAFKRLWPRPKVELI